MFISIALKLTIGLAALIVVVRLVGKKALSEITPFDIIYALVLGGILEESIYDDQVRVLHVLFALALWAGLIYIIEVLLQKRDTATRKIKGKPSVLVYQGRLNLQEIEENHIEMEQLRNMMREQNCFSLREVEHMVLEADGQHTLKKKQDAESSFSFLVIDEGKLELDTLASMDKDESWLEEELRKAGLPAAENIVYGEWSEEAGLYCQAYEDCIHQRITIDG